MRVIAGTARSLPLRTPDGPDTRPTTDRIKETLFNMLQNDVPGAVFVDQTLFFGVADHVVRGTGLYGPAYVHRLELHEDFGHVGRRHPAKAHQRSVPHRVKYAVADHGSTSSSTWKDDEVRIGLTDGPNFFM